MSQFKSSAQSRVIVKREFHGTELSLESGWVAKQSSGAVIVRAGDTMVLCTVCTAAARPDQDFFPLVVDYVEKTYAAGKIPGGFFKREGRLAESEILTCRLIDRPIRPLFPDGFMDEVQVICTVLSADENNNAAMLAICGASAALHISEIPFEGPLAGLMVGRIDNQFVINPSPAQREKSELEFIVAGTKDAIVMVEGGAQIVPEQEVLEALFYGHEQLQQIIEMQEELRQKVGKAKMEFAPKVVETSFHAKALEFIGNKLESIFEITSKHDRSDAFSQLKQDVIAALGEEYAEHEKAIKNFISELYKEQVRKRVVDKKIRLDGRGLTDVRPIECEVGLLPRVHGSALFTRGETQAIVTTTVGTANDAQRIDALTGGEEKDFMLHYNFPPFSTGEVKMLRGTGRREVGHGALAERALRPVVPTGKDFPYVLRIVSEVTESNGSSSMASVCGGSLSLMDAGINISSPVAGIAMGLIKEGDKVAVLTDILGDEDHLGDMDFKVTGTDKGITALQMDIKCAGLSQQIMQSALEQAKQARLHILSEMNKTLSAGRTTMNKYAPVVHAFSINPDKIRDVIGPGGKTIKSIIESTGVKIDISDDGTVHVASADADASKRAIEIIKSLTEEAEIGRIYHGVVKRITDFGAFVEILPGIDGLVHISQLADRRIENVSEVLKEGDEIPVLVLDIDRQGRVRLSYKDALSQQAGEQSQNS